jgi:flagellar biosynthesis protein FlhB
MNDEMLENILRASLAARPPHIPYGDLAQRATRLARQQAAHQLVRLRRMSQLFSAIAMLSVVAVLLVGYRRYSIIAQTWASTDAASTLNANTISTTWMTYQSPAMVVVVLIAAVIVGLSILWQFAGDDPRAGFNPILG